MGFGDLVLFCVVTGMSVRWIAAAATIGPAGITIWVGAWLLFALPLLFAVLKHSTRYPEREGGIYDWSRHALGDWAGFMSGWTYWASNLPYYPALLVFAAGAAAYLVAGDPKTLAADPLFVLSFSLSALWIATLINVVGLSTGKWLHNVGAVTNWAPIAILLGVAYVARQRFGSATRFDAHAFVPHGSLKDVIFWAGIVFAVGGSEASAFVRHEVPDPKRQLPRALIVSSAICVGGYILGTLAILVI